ncbi:AAA family ATPase [Nocardia sp. NPDC046473]|uniref:ATP-binding protein n=1 Tax=Nocardia sp. NPDC046473 TaxID=3155733 RepID=UPI0033F5BAC9
MRPDMRLPERHPDSGLLPDLVGREHECAAMEHALDRLSRGSSALIEVMGDPGLGKTRLLGELMALAATRGLRVRAAQASRSRQHVPFGVLLDAFTAEEATQGCRRLAAVDAHDRYLRYEEIRLMLTELATPGLVLALDDLHWIDEQSADLLTHLVRRPPPGPVLLALAYRQRQAPGRLRAAFAETLSAAPPIRLQLGPLSEGEADRLLGGRCSPSLYHASGGNPLYLDVLARNVIAARNGGPGAAGREYPVAIEAAVLAELETLSPPSQQVARAAAVAGELFCDGAVADAGGFDRDTVLAAFTEMAELDLIRPATGNLFAFRHSIVQSVIYASTNPAWRLTAHARVAAALKRMGLPASVQAYHIERAAEFDDPEAVAVLEDAASSVSGYSPAMSARWLSAALRLLPDTAVDHRARLLLDLARAFIAAGRLRESRERLHQVLALLPREPTSRRADAVVLCATANRLLGRRAEGRALLTDEIATLATEPAGEPRASALAALTFELACNSSAGGDLAGCRLPATQSLAVIPDRNRLPLHVAAHGHAAAAAAAAGAVSTAAAHLDAAVPLLDSMLDGALTERLDAALWVARGEFLLERPTEALRHLDRGRGLARDFHRYLVLPDLLVTRALTLRDLGRLAEAAECAGEAVELAELTGGLEQRTAALAARCAIAAWAGDADEAMRTGAAAVACEVGGLTAVFARKAYAEACLAIGDADRCLSQVTGLGGPDLPEVGAWWRVGWYEMLTRAALAAGRPREAAEWARRCHLAAQPLRLAGRGGIAALAQAQALCAEADTGTAHDALASAGLVLDAARARLVEGVALARCGDDEQAAVRLLAAHTQFEACGAAGLARQAISERRRLAARSPRRSPGQHPHGLAGLTRREQQIAQLVGDGLTNGRIAAHLHVTEKTVEKHLSNVFAKLGVSARSQVAAAVVLAARAN